jgi:hypothetical protein
MTRDELIEELRDMASELASENWGATWSFDEYAATMREAATAIAAAKAEPAEDAVLGDVIQALDRYLRRDETASDIDTAVYRQGLQAMSAAISAGGRGGAR